MKKTKASPSNDQQDKAFEILGRVALAFGSPSRLRLIQLLAQAPKSVEKLADDSGQTIANTSQHLQRLAREGLVMCDRKGVSRIYRLGSPGVAALWESLQDLAGELVADLTIAEEGISEPEIRSSNTVADALAAVARKEAVLLDVREAEESVATPVPGAIIIPLSKLRAAMGELPRRMPIYVFCRGRYCTMASEAVRKLRAAGFESFRLRESPLRLSATRKSNKS